MYIQVFKVWTIFLLSCGKNKLLCTYTCCYVYLQKVAINTIKYKANERFIDHILWNHSLADLNTLFCFLLILEIMDTI